MASIPLTPDAVFTRRQLSTVLTELGYPVAYTSLATMSHRGTGPKYRRFGTRSLYRWADVLAWLEVRVSAPRSGTAEGRAIDSAEQTARAGRAANAEPVQQQA